MVIVGIEDAPNPMHPIPVQARIHGDLSAAPHAYLYHQTLPLGGYINSPAGTIKAGAISKTRRLSGSNIPLFFLDRDLA
jgi:hypothetical protein